MIDEGLVSLLTFSPGVAGIIGDRVYQVEPPVFDPALYPCLSYKFVGGAADPTLNTSGTIRQRIELTAHSQDASEAANLRVAVIKAVNGWCGRLSDGTHVLNTYLLNPGTDYFGEDLVFHRMCEFYVLYTLPS
jgi:hypothetical protein